MAIDQEKLLKDLAALPPDEQKQVIDYVAFLRSRLKPKRSKKAVAGTEEPDLINHPFIGMWKDREDMKDSVAWVREVRKREWRNQG